MSTPVHSQRGEKETVPTSAEEDKWVERRRKCNERVRGREGDERREEQLL